MTSFSLTILTPTYNRATLLRDLHASLMMQTCMDFEWVIVDDGSVDHTSELIEDFSEDKSFPIRYFKKYNGGKHTAINRGLQEAKGTLTLILDSDDELPFYAVETIKQRWEELSAAGHKGHVGGICFYMAHRNGEVIGTPLYNDIETNSIEMRYRLGISGDMCEIFKTDVLKQFPFPEFAQEKFCPEQLIWFRIAQKYNLRLYRDVVYYRDYLEGGLTDHIVKIRMESPMASCMTYGEMLSMKIPFRAKIKAAINYWRFKFCITFPIPSSLTFPHLSMLWRLLLPLGYVVHLKDKRKVTISE